MWYTVIGVHEIDMPTSLFCKCFVCPAILAFLLAGTDTAYGQTSVGPQPMPLPPPLPTPVDKAYLGTLSLSVDLTNVNDRVVNVRETIPVKAGAMTLLYPEWLPGTHSPSNAVTNLSGLTVAAGDTPVRWTRDRVNMWAFHLEVPKGATALQLSFTYLAPVRAREGRISNAIADLTWNSVLLYPAGYFARRIQFAPELRLPEGWNFATALEVKSQNRNLVQFQETTLNTLVDSPVYAGTNYKRLDVSSGPDNLVYLDVFADRPEQLAVTAEELQYHKNLVVQAQKLFASRHYDHYDFLLSVSETVGGKGLEHHQSSEDGTRGNYFTDWAGGVFSHALLPHEYTHSWNGKFRRPAGLWTANFNVPMQNELLWVYEGLTDYYGNVLAARSGMRTLEQARDIIAGIAANFEMSPGRNWRSLEDTTNQAIISSHGARPEDWPSWQRGVDYYQESDLIWLDVDTKIRQMSDGHKSLDDFAKLFFGIDNRSWVTVTYTLEDTVKALNTVQPYDWTSYFRTHVYAVAPDVPTAGIEQGGYQLVYTDAESDWMKHTDTSRGASFATSLGFSLQGEDSDSGQANAGDRIRDVWWESPAFKAGITPDMQLTGVNDQVFSVGTLREAILAAKNSRTPIKLLLKRGRELVTVDLACYSGMRYPHLKRDESKPDLLDEILAAVK